MLILSILSLHRVTGLYHGPPHSIRHGNSGVNVRRECHVGIHQTELMEFFTEAQKGLEQIPSFDCNKD